MIKNSTRSLFDAALHVLTAETIAEKCAAAHSLRREWMAGRLSLAPPKATPPDRPARPSRPRLVNPGDVPRRRLGSEAGRVALLHAVAHIEFNAIDLAADMTTRFGRSPFLSEGQRPRFISDWTSVCDDEARHFAMIRRRLNELGADYGDLPAHDGLWQAAEATRHDLLARLAIAPMVLEARGLDVTPPMIKKLRDVGDNKSADCLQIIYDDEIGHVAKGKYWFSTLSGQNGKSDADAFQRLVRQYYRGLLKPPFNVAARDLAGFPLAYYEPLTRPLAP